MIECKLNNKLIIVLFILGIIIIGSLVGISAIRDNSANGLMNSLIGAFGANPSCLDTDGGLKYTTKGAISCDDYCEDSDILIEYYYSTGIPLFTRYSCIANSYTGCSNGACYISSPPTNCTDTDGGKIYNVKGTCNSASGTWTDYCMDSERLVEFHCDATNNCTSPLINCSAIGYTRCNNGAYYLNTSITTTYHCGYYRKYGTASIGLGKPGCVQGTGGTGYYWAKMPASQPPYHYTCYNNPISAAKVNCTGTWQCSNTKCKLGGVPDCKCIG